MMIMHNLSYCGWLTLLLTSYYHSRFHCLLRKYVRWSPTKILRLSVREEEDLRQGCWKITQLSAVHQRKPYCTIEEFFASPGQIPELFQNTTPFWQHEKHDSCGNMKALSSIIIGRQRHRSLIQTNDWLQKRHFMALIPLIGSLFWR